MIPSRTVLTGIDLEDALAKLPDRDRKGISFPWTKELEDALVKYWPIKNQSDVAKIVGCSKNTALAKYRELTQK